MGVQLTIQNGSAFSMQDLKEILPHSKAVREYEETKKQRDDLIVLTQLLDEHPDHYEGPCECKLCASYAAQDHEKGGES